MDIRSSGSGAESVGALLSRVRTTRGVSQLRLAELLCAASGLPTVTRHEVSRWEREERLPSGHWLRWLSTVLDLPLDALGDAVAEARTRRATARSSQRATVRAQTRQVVTGALGPLAATGTHGPQPTLIGAQMRPAASLRPSASAAWEGQRTIGTHDARRTGDGRERASAGVPSGAAGNSRQHTTATSTGAGSPPRAADPPSHRTTGTAWTIPATKHPLWTVPGVTELARMLDHDPPEPLRLAHAWLTTPRRYERDSPQSWSRARGGTRGVAGGNGRADRTDRHRRIDRDHLTGNSQPTGGRHLTARGDPAGHADPLGVTRRPVTVDRPGTAGPTGIDHGDQPRTTCQVPGSADGDVLDALQARLHGLRLTDDMVGGADLASVVDRELRAALALLAADWPARRRRRLLRIIAELAQLSGWTAADAGLPRRATRAYGLGLSAAAEAGDRVLGAHLLGCLSHLTAATADPADALLLARTGYAGVRRSRPTGVHVLLLHRMAFAAALAHERRTSERALLAAERAADRRDPAGDPSWLYWLDAGELAALTGRCFTALRRPLRAEPLLCPRPALRVGPRTAALDGGWLAETYLDAGEVEQACTIGRKALLDAVRCGSVRATARIQQFRSRLPVGCPATTEFVELLAAVQPYLPRPSRELTDVPDVRIEAVGVPGGAGADAGGLTTGG